MNILNYQEIQTPPDVWSEILKLNPIDENDVFLEPFAGECSLYNQVTNKNKDWCEITRDKDIFNYDFKNSLVSCIYTNPPFKAMIKGKYKNSVYYFLEYFMIHFPKLEKIGFLINAKSFQSITPKRMAKLNSLGFYVCSITLLNCNYWYGLYYFILFDKQQTNKCIKVIEKTFKK